MIRDTPSQKFGVEEVQRTPTIVTAIAALSLLAAPVANAAGMEKQAKPPGGNSSAVQNSGGDTNVSQGNKCIIVVPQQQAVNENGLVPYLSKMLLGIPKGTADQKAQNTNNIQCNVGNITDNHPGHR